MQVTRLKVNSRRRNFDEIEDELRYLGLKSGGKSPTYKERLQENREKIAIIIPYRDRLVNLELLLRNLHSFLNRQNAYYGVYVIEPIANLTFNKGLSMNAGFIEALKEEHWSCFIFHDVDLLPENDQNVYSCDRFRPKLLAVSISAYGYS